MPLREAAERRVRYLTKDEVERFFAAIPENNTRDKLLFEVIYRHGLRRVEATMLRLNDLSNGRVWITRAKNGISGEYPIHPHTRKLLWRYVNERRADGNPHLFVSRQGKDGGPLSEPLIYHLFRRYAKLANLPRDRQHPHVLRHAIAVHLLTTGWDLVDVQDWLGHKDIKSTVVYARIVNKRREMKYEEALHSKEIAANDSD
ncbi:MAG TPA: tyrosine-type recombinase/integrase [Thermoanaerobaculia bacterium]|nr:tyrosine-type recombinase/integrase [Thermoanaerobaculia bacterium]